MLNDIAKGKDETQVEKPVPSGFSASSSASGGLTDIGFNKDSVLRGGKKVFNFGNDNIIPLTVLGFVIGIILISRSK